MKFLQNVITHPVFEAGKSTEQSIAKSTRTFSRTPNRTRHQKLLRYLADVLVNGHPDVPKPDPSRVFQHAVVPSWDRSVKSAIRNQATPRRIGAGEVRRVDERTSWRSIHRHHAPGTRTSRCLPPGVPTQDMLRVAEAFAQHHPQQLFSMEKSGRCDLRRSAPLLTRRPVEAFTIAPFGHPNILLQMLIRGANAVGYTSYPDNLVEKFIEKSWENGVDVFRIFDSLNWIKSMEVSIRAVRERTGGLAESLYLLHRRSAGPEAQQIQPALLPRHGAADWKMPA